MLTGLVFGGMENTATLHKEHERWTNISEGIYPKKDNGDVFRIIQIMDTTFKQESEGFSTINEFSSSLSSSSAQSWNHSMSSPSP